MTKLIPTSPKHISMIGPTQGAPWTCTEDPVCPEGNTLDVLREELKHYQHALEWPVLEYADLVPDYTPSGLDTEEAF